MDQYEINYSVVQQLPMRARDALVTIDYGDINIVARALAQLDLSFEENRNCDPRRSLPNNNSSPNNPAHSGKNSNGPKEGNNPSQTAAYRARGIEVDGQPWYSFPDFSVPPPQATANSLEISNLTIPPQEDESSN